MATYTEGSELGKGTFGVVKNAKSDQGDDVAIKTFVDPGISHVTREDLIRRFNREVRLQSSINHVNVVKILDSNLRDDPPWFVMELGESSLKNFSDNGLLTSELKRKSLFDVLSGLEAIHELGYKHRDLKPANVIYIDNELGGRFAISDFGLGAPKDGESSTLTATGVQGGTESYAAPELAKSFRRATPAADIYSFGAILHDFFVGRRRTPYAKQYGNGPIGKIIEKCTEPLPARRYQVIADLRADLYAALENLDAEATSEEDALVIEILGKEEVTSQEWDYIFMRIDDLEDEGRFSRKLILAFDGRHIQLLGEEYPELLIVYIKHLLEYVIYNEGGFGFDFCDVLADQMLLPWEMADVEGKAYIMLALLVLGASHNRWYVERRFASVAGPMADDNFLKRMIAEAEAREINLSKHIRHISYSISVEASDLHEFLRKYTIDEDR
jgi:serine/threonine protein kinase